MHQLSKNQKDHLNYYQTIYNNVHHAIFFLIYVSMVIMMCGNGPDLPEEIHGEPQLIFKIIGGVYQIQ